MPEQCPVVGTIEQPCIQFNSVYDAVIGGPYSQAHSGALSLANKSTVVILVCTNYVCTKSMHIQL